MLFSCFSFFFLNAACPLLEGYYRCGYIFSLFCKHRRRRTYLCTRIPAYTISCFDRLSILATIRLLCYIWCGSFFPALHICRVGVAIYMYFFYPPVHLFLCGRVNARRPTLRELAVSRISFSILCLGEYGLMRFFSPGGCRSMGSRGLRARGKQELFQSRSHNRADIGI